MKVICMIPARYKSTRFEGKALADINGKPMIQQVYERASGYAGSYWTGVVTDDERIAKCVKNFGGNIIMTPADCRTGTDRASNAAESFLLECDDIVVNIQGDQPLIQTAHVEQVVSALAGDAGFPAASLAFKITSAREIAGANSVKVVFGADHQAIYFSRWPIPFQKDGNGTDIYKHIGIYAYRAWFLRQFSLLPSGVLEKAESLEQLRILENGYKIKIGVTEIDSPSVDTPEDIRRVGQAIESCGGCAG